MSKNFKIVIGLLAACVILTVLPFGVASKDAQFGGADDAAGKAVEALNPDFEPWALPVLEKILGGELPGETESLLFCLQAAFGSGIICFGFGYFAARKRFSGEEAVK